MKKTITEKELMDRMNEASLSRNINWGCPSSHMVVYGDKKTDLVEECQSSCYRCWCQSRDRYLVNVD